MPISSGSSGWTEPSSFILQIKRSTGGIRSDGPATPSRDEELPVGVFVDWAASTPLTGGDIHSITGLGGLGLGLGSPAKHDDDGLARRFDAWSDGQVWVVVPLTIREPVPASSRNRWSLAGAEHRHPLLITELRTDAPTPIRGFEEIEALGSLNCVSLLIGRSLVVVSVVKVLTESDTVFGTSSITWRGRRSLPPHPLSPRPGTSGHKYH